MKKLLLFGLILFTSPILINAKSTKPINCNHSGDLLQTLVANSDFRQFCNKLSAFGKEVYKKKSITELQKIVNKTATEEEKKSFLIKLEYNSFEDLNNYFKEILILRNTITKEYPNLLLPNNNIIIKTAIETVLKKEHSKLLPDECVAAWAFTVFICELSYPDNLEDFQYCMFFAMMEFAACLIISG